jgi:HEAT repeat protein
MDVKTFEDLPPWEWPEDAAEVFLGVLRDDQAEESARLTAAELAGDFTVINDELSNALLEILHGSKESDDIRARAAISLGPALEYAYADGFEYADEVAISENKFHEICESLRKLFLDSGVPKEVRRRILEAAVRAPQQWHQEAIREAYSSGDESWKLTAIFCMRFVRGFDDQILEALESGNQNFHFQAVCAAGNWEVEAAWPHIAALITGEGTDKPLLLAAIEAVPGIRPQNAAEILFDLTGHEDEDISEAAYEAMAMAEALLEEEDYDENE